MSATYALRAAITAELLRNDLQVGDSAVLGSHELLEEETIAYSRFTSSLRAQGSHTTLHLIQ